MTRVAVFGGSFNPPHIGHALVIQWLLWSGEVDQVIIVPSEGHPLKKDPPADIEVRHTMLVGMAEQDLGATQDAHLYRGYVPASHSRVIVSRVEHDMPKPAYTYDMLTKLKKRLPPDWELNLVVGTDILAESDRWYKWDALVKEFGLILVGRSGYDAKTEHPVFPSISSTEIRKMMAEGDPAWKKLVTPSVRALLERNLPAYPLG